jgi:hypothetical protein
MPQHIVAKAPMKSIGTSLHRYLEKGIKLQTKLNPDHTIAELFPYGPQLNSNTLTVEWFLTRLISFQR